MVILEVGNGGEKKNSNYTSNMLDITLLSSTKLSTIFYLKTDTNLHPQRYNSVGMSPASSVALHTKILELHTTRATDGAPTEPR